MNKQGYNQYKQNSIYTASPEELTLMLYNGLIKFIMKAQFSISKSDIEGANGNILRSQAIVTELAATVDEKYEISTSLIALYDYMNRRLIEANMKKNSEILEEVLTYAKQFRDTWEQAMRIAKQPAKKDAVGI
ncbi:MAG TPA: flagellar export chaperone FliS [Thermoclostridium sp.]|nr:flagellar export chaperone FliS [Thermoclostridium sp.]